MKKILVLGGTGMLGHVLYRYLDSTSKFELYNICFKKKLNSSSIIIDVTNDIKLNNIILKIKPDLIINCIGILIKKSNQDIKNSIYINSYLPHHLKELCDRINSKLIHISTDCVFDGIKGGYDENSLKNASDDYGKTKALGEVFSNTHLCIRTSIIGPELKENGEGLLHWLFSQNGKIYGYKNVYWSGVTTLELSKVILYSIEKNINGLWHVSNGTKISKFNLIKLLIEIFSIKKLILLENNSVFSDKSLKSVRKINYMVPSYKNMLLELKDFYSKNKSIYNYQI